MRTNQARFITACQQLLALGVVLAVLAPATNIVSLDVVSQPPVSSGLTLPAGQSSSAAAPVVDTATVPTAEVPAAPVEPKVAEYAITKAPTRSPKAQAPKAQAPKAQSSKPQAPKAQAPKADSHDHTHGLAADVDEDEVVNATVSAPVEGFGAVGVTWDGASRVAEGQLALEVRTRVGETWGEWSELAFHDDHAPDADSPDAALARGGTDALIVGDVDEVEVRADAAGALPEGLSLAVVDPGTAKKTQLEGPAIESGAAADKSADSDATADAEGDLVLQAGGKSAPKPTIYSRAQWGANEKIRDKSSLRYGTISAGFVHHTVNANNYTAEQVPEIIRSIYAYHVKSRGWSDVGYNFLVDRFGRIWEGRYGGVDKAVVGAHTLGYNDYAFAMSAIGNFETAKPSQAMVNAYGALMAWKLSLHGVNPTATKQKVGKGTFPAINGHRDAGSTACPGQYLYAKLAEIRKLAAAAQTGQPTSPTTPTPTPTPKPTPAPGPTYSQPVKQSNLVGTSHPDIVVRRASDNRLLIIPTGGLSALKAPKVIGSGIKAKSRIISSPDLTGDGRADVVTVDKAGIASIHPGDGKGGFAAAKRKVKGTKDHNLLTAAGDLNGDRRADLVARNVKTGKAFGFLRKANGGFLKVALKRSLKSYVSLHAVGDITGDGRADLLARDSAGTVWTLRGGVNTLAAPVRTPGTWSSYPTIAGGGDFNRDGRTDVLVRTRSGVLQILPGRGDGSFDAPLGPLGTRKNLNNLTVSVATSSGVPEMIARRGNSLVVLSNPGTYDLGTPVGTGTSAGGVTTVINAGDFDGDGFGDVISIRNDGMLQLRRGNGTGKLANPGRIGIGFAGVKGLEAVGDINGDGKADLVGTVSGQVRFYAGRGTGTVAAGVAAPGLSGVVSRMKTSSSYDPTRYDWKIAISDAQLAKGNTDLVARELKTGRLYLFDGSPSGLSGRRYLGGGLEAYNLAG